MSRCWRRAWVGAALGSVALFLLGYTLFVERLVTITDSRAPRNTETGILLGAEPRDLGPEDAVGAVLFVHGFLGGANNFAELPDQVAEAGWRVRVMRLPGHGTSPKDLRETTADELANAVLTEATALKAKYGRVVLVGHSMGGALSTLTAAQADVDGLILGAPYFGVTHYWYYGFTPKTWIRIASPFVRWLYKGSVIVLVNRPEAKKQILSYRWTPVEGVTTLMEIGRRVNQPAVLDAVTCPVLLLHGAEDGAAEPAAAHAALARMASKDKRSVVLNRSDHHVFWDYDRALVAQETLQFLARIAEEWEASPPRAPKAAEKK
ncbi:MAG: alpha/beta fold hydrolase [Nitrospiraceae bacterium]|nr:alpha/beta fold hydrolase [Nitrospiraceae bacterium]